MLVNTERCSLTENKEEIVHITLDNERGVRIRITNYGGIITHIFTPDKDGNDADIVLGFDTPGEYYSEAYQSACAYFGAITGRYCNRIANGKYLLDGQEFQLGVNAGMHHLHGGFRGFDKVVWQAETACNESSASVFLNHLSVDGDQGYPGNLQIRVSYTLTSNNELIVDYECITDKATPLNLTNHSYFNLSGNFTRSVLDHEVTIHAEAFTEINESLIPTGNMLAVEGSALDFREASTIREKLCQMPGGFDHNFVLNPSENRPAEAVSVWDRFSGRLLEIYTTEPGFQFFTLKVKNFPVPLKGGIDLNTYCGLALEPQHFPDSPNHPGFPDTILRPGKTYRQQTIYKFSVKY